jgi:hypothetical protein
MRVRSRILVLVGSKRALDNPQSRGGVEGSQIGGGDAALQVD